VVVVSSSQLSGRCGADRSLSITIDSLSAVARLRRVPRVGAAPGTSVSQYGQIVHAWSSGREQLAQRSFSLRKQLGQRMKSRSIR
jgi:hypothetical protein